MHLPDSNGGFNHIPDPSPGDSNRPATGRELRLVIGFTVGVLVMLALIVGTSVLLT